MKTEQVMCRLMNHDSDLTPVFEKYTLNEYNELYDTKYNSIKEAIDIEPEYLFDEDQMTDYLQ